MKITDIPVNAEDPVILEVRAIKRQIVAEHNGDLDSLFASIRKRQASNPRLVKSRTPEPDGARNRNRG